MKIILKSCTIVTADNTFDGKQDILIENGTIIRIAPSIDEAADQIIERENLHVSAGWFDARVSFSDPGHEEKEELSTGLKASELGGMTAVAVMPNTVPTVSNKSQIEYLKMKSAFSPVSVYPYGTLTSEMEGKNLSEMYDMQEAGAIGFTDGHHPVSGGIMYRALLYAKNFGGNVISFPLNNSIFGKGYVHEGKVSVMTGLKAIPSLAESITVERDINLLRYTEAKLHFTGISTKESVELIRNAKAEGLNVTADVYVHNLVYTQEDVMGFDSAYKVLPPYRATEDRDALIAGVKDGTIDFVCSDHSPHDIENKDVEFDQAAFGIIGTQTLYPMLNQIEALTQEEKINLISAKPRSIYGLPDNSICEGDLADLTLFNPDGEFILTKENSASKSANSPILDTPLKGEVYGLISEGILSLVS